MVNNDSNNNVSSFLRQNEFRYETVAEVSNDWLLGGNMGANNSNQAAIDMPFVNQNMEKRNEVLDIMGNQQMSQTNSHYTEPQWSFDNINQQP
jgi:hypothetical protein